MFKQHCDMTKVAPWQQVSLCMVLLISDGRFGLQFI